MPINATGMTLTVGSVTFCPTSITAIGYEMNEMLDTTTLCNVEYFTGIAPTLKRVQDISFTCNFEPADLAAIKAEIGVNQSIAITYTDTGTTTVTLWGYLHSYAADSGAIDAIWTASGVIKVTNTNGSGAETGPVIS